MMRFCQNCGSELEQSVKFCPSCGAPQAGQSGYTGSYTIPQSTEIAPANSQRQPSGNSVSESFRTMMTTTFDSITNMMNRSGTQKESPSSGKDAPTSAVPEIQTAAGRQTGGTESTKCPNCQGVVNSFTAFCPYCGAELHNNAAASACQELCDRLEQIEASRPKATIMSSVTALVSRAADGSKIDSTDQRKIELIGNYVVPNNKSDIMEFLFMAESRIDACKKALEPNNGRPDAVQQALLNVWTSKYEQVMKKGQIILANDPDFRVLADSYQREKNKAAGVCQYCGGQFKGMIKKVCSKCGTQKDY